ILSTSALSRLTLSAAAVIPPSTPPPAVSAPLLSAPSQPRSFPSSLCAAQKYAACVEPPSCRTALRAATTTSFAPIVPTKRTLPTNKRNIYPLHENSAAMECHFGRTSFSTASYNLIRTGRSLAKRTYRRELREVCAMGNITVVFGILLIIVGAVGFALS